MIKIRVFKKDKLSEDAYNFKSAKEAVNFLYQLLNERSFIAVIIENEGEL